MCSVHVSSMSSKPETIKVNVQHAFTDFVLLRGSDLVSESVTVLVVHFQCIEIIGRLWRLESYEHRAGHVWSMSSLLHVAQITLKLKFSVQLSY